MGKLDADGGNEEAAEMAVPFGQPFCSNKLSVVAVAEHFSDRDGAKTEVQLEKLSLAALWLKADATTVELSAGFRRLDRRNRPKSTDLAFFIRELFAKSPLCSSAAT
jgi:hypothetical protein